MIETQKQKREKQLRLFWHFHADKLKDTSRAKYLIYEIYWTRENWGTTFDYSEGKIIAGNEKKLFDKLELEKTSAKDAQIMIIIGEQDFGKAWLKGTYKRYYMKPKPIKINPIELLNHGKLLMIK